MVVTSLLKQRNTKRWQLTPSQQNTYVPFVWDVSSSKGLNGGAYGWPETTLIQETSQNPKFSVTGSKLYASTGYKVRKKRRGRQQTPPTYFRKCVIAIRPTLEFRQ